MHIDLIIFLFSNLVLFIKFIIPDYLKTLITVLAWFLGPSSLLWFALYMVVCTDLYHVSVAPFGYLSVGTLFGPL